MFRYALERWPVDAYRLVVFHDGDLTEAQQSLQNRLGGYSEIGYGRPPLVLEWADVADTIPEHLAEIWHEVRETPVPLMVLLPPAMGGEDVILWTAPLSAASTRNRSSRATFRGRSTAATTPTTSTLVTRTCSTTPTTSGPTWSWGRRRGSTGGWPGPT